MPLPSTSAIVYFRQIRSDVAKLFMNSMKILMNYAWQKGVLGKVQSDMTLFDEDDLGEDKDYHTSASRRKKRVLDMLESPAFTALFILFVLRTFPIRFMANWLSKYSRLRTPFNDSMQSCPDYEKFPPLLNMLNPKYSPIWVCMQFYGLILTRGSEWSRALMMWCPPTMSEHEWLQIIRRQMLDALCKFHRRHRYRANEGEITKTRH